MLHVTYADKVRAERALNLATLDAGQAALVAVLQERIDTDAEEARDTVDELANWKQASAEARDKALDSQKRLTAMADTLCQFRHELESSGRMNRRTILRTVKAAEDEAVALADELNGAADLLA